MEIWPQGPVELQHDDQLPNSKETGLSRWSKGQLQTQVYSNRASLIGQPQAQHDRREAVRSPMYAEQDGEGKLASVGLTTSKHTEILPRETGSGFIPSTCCWPKLLWQPRKAKSKHQLHAHAFSHAFTFSWHSRQGVKTKNTQFAARWRIH